MALSASTAEAQDARAQARKHLDEFLAGRPLPESYKSDVRAIFEDLCDRDVAPGRAEGLAKKVILTDPAIAGEVLKLVRGSKERGEALAKAVEKRIAEAE